jgi:hypothetical protein
MKMSTHKSTGMTAAGLSPTPLDSTVCGGRVRSHICKYVGTGLEVADDKIELMVVKKGQKLLPHISYAVGDLADDTIKASIDGLTSQFALNAAAAAAAGLSGVIGNNNALTYTVDVAGVNGNDYFVELVDPGANDQALAVSVKGQRITVSLATGAGGAITSTGAEVFAAVNTAAGGVTVTHTGASTGAAAVVAAEVNLAGGVAAGVASLAGVASSLDVAVESASRTLYATVTGAIPVGKIVVFGIFYAQV